jgi:hypothetical protein
MKTILHLLVAVLTFLSPPATAQLASTVSASTPSSAAKGTYTTQFTYAPDSPTYYRNTHGEKERVEVFRRDPNIWVYTPEVAKRAGMPLEWASDELKGVAAAAFRVERDGAEEDCGWGGDRKACKPVVQCVLELYFDRQLHPLPWDMKRMVADFDWQRVSTAYHLLPALGFRAAENGNTSRGDQTSPNYPDVGARQPFTDPDTNSELFWASPNSLGYLRVHAYDREIHGRYAFVRLDFGCHRGLVEAKPLVLHLQLKDLATRKPIKVVTEIYIPASWNLRTLQHAEQEQKRSEDFYRQIWNNINQGAKK